MAAVPTWKIAKAESRGLANVDHIAVACREAGVPFYVACALFTKESGGRNVYGHDAGGALSGFPNNVTRDNFLVFRWLVIEKGALSNGVGPSQITYAGSLKNGRRDGGYFREMESQGLDPWDVHDNMLKGLMILKGHYLRSGKSWRAAGTAYNGRTEYGIDLEKRIADWKSYLSQR